LKPGAPLAPKAVRHAHTMLHKALNDAVRWGRVNRNVADLAEPPRPSTPEMKVYDTEQLRVFLDAVKDDRLYAAWLLMVTTGMRRGEALGLRWSDVNLDAGRISVVRTLTVVRAEVMVSEPKTAKGRRSVALDPATVAQLRIHRRKQREEQLAFGEDWNDEQLVFTQEDGNRIHPTRFSHWFAAHAQRAGLPRIRLHDLRHNYAAAALSAGIPAKVVSERLGHANVSITLDTYSHVLPALQEDAANAVAALSCWAGSAQALPASRSRATRSRSVEVLEQLVDSDREVADAGAEGIVHGVGDRRRGADDADLAEALGAGRPECVLGLVQPGDVELIDVGVDGDVVLGEVVVDDVAEGRVEDALFVQRHGQAHGHSAYELRPCRRGVEDVAGGEHSDEARDPHFGGVEVDVDLRELGTEGEPGDVGAPGDVLGR
jgi:integrase